MLLSTKAVILAKIETAYSVDPTPTALANAILCEAPSIEPISKKLERGNVKPYYGSRNFISIGEGYKISFTTELKGSGQATTAPEIGVLFRACNFTETTVLTPGSESVKYNPHSTPDGESLTLYFYMHNLLHKVVGCRGTGPSLESKVNEYGKLKWEFQGIYAGPADQNIPASPTFNQTKPPLFRNANFTLDTYAAVIETLKISMKNDLAKRPNANSVTGIAEYFIKEHAVTGEIDPEMVPRATKDFWGMWESGGIFAFSATFGSVAGNRCVITAPGVQLDAMKYANRDNILTLAMPLVYAPVNGDDDIEYKFN